MFPFAVGYRTYIIAAAMIGVAVSKVVGFPLPEEVWMILGALGLGSLRAAVEEVKK